MKTIENLVEKKRSQIILFVILDLLFLFLSSLIALSLRFDFGAIPNMYIEALKSSYIIDCIILLFIFIGLKLYTSVWRYASVTELLNVITSCTLLEILSFSYHTICQIMLPRSFFIIRLLLMIFFTGGTRFFHRILKTVLLRKNKKNRKKNTMIIGAGDAGRLLIDEIYNNNSFDDKIVCIIDDNKNLKGTYFKNIPVCGGRQSIATNVEKYKVEKIIIAIPSAPKEEIAKIVDECQKTKCEISILPSIYATLNNEEIEITKSVRPLSYEDFLGRNQIVVNNEEITNNIKDKIILVTGGGGSIGSELCRQIAKASPKTLIIFDIYENNAYDIQQELLRNYPNIDLHTIIGSVRDYDRLEKVFIDLKPEMVFHAAAHKHVPLMEVSPNEAIKNNCLGTLNVAKLSNKYKVKKFVLVSTDKAVRPTNNNHINAMMLEDGYGEGNPIAAKSEFILSLFEQLLKKHCGLGPIDKSIIDRCTSIVYERFKDIKESPTLLDLKNVLNEQPEEQAHNLALSLEIYSEGSLDIFAHQTNVNTNNRIITYNIHKLGKSLKTFGLLVITDAILNRVNQNYKIGKRTHIFIDEFHVMFQNEYSANFFNSAWRQFRKRNAYPTAITQNVQYLLSSVEASTMLSNSEFIIMLNQATNDRLRLAELLNISEDQLSYIKDSDPGCGLIRYGSSLVPFVNKFPMNTKLYKLMTTKPGE